MESDEIRVLCFVSSSQLQTKVESVVDALMVPVEAYLACEDDYYRKVKPLTSTVVVAPCFQLRYV